MNQPIVFLDVETTGTDTGKDRIIQIGSIKLNPDFTSCGEFKNMLLNPGGPIPPESTLVHGITDEMVQGKPFFQQISKALFEYLQGCIIAGYNNLNFDIPILSEEFDRCGIIYPAPGAFFYDAYKIFAAKVPRTLEGAVNYYLNRPHDGAHDAAFDTQATIEVFREQLRQYPDLEQMTPYELHRFCVGEGTIDLAGKIGLNSDGKPIYLFGKDKGKVIRESTGFAYWMLKDGQSFPAETKRILKQILFSKKDLWEDM